MGLKLPKLPRQVTEMGLKPMDNTPKPIRVIRFTERMNANKFEQLKAEWDSMYERNEAPCAEVCCLKKTHLHLNPWFPFCSWDCKDWDEQIKRR